MEQMHQRLVMHQAQCKFETWKLPFFLKKNGLSFEQLSNLLILHCLLYRSCAEGCLDSSLVKGKIVLCNEMLGVTEADRVGSLGVVALDFDYNVSAVLPLPASTLSEQNFGIVAKYVQSTR